MTVRDDVEALVSRLSPEPICDDCIAQRLGLPGSQHANQKTRAMAGMNGFERQKHVCSLCDLTRMVIRRR